VVGLSFPSPHQDCGVHPTALPLRNPRGADECWISISGGRRSGTRPRVAEDLLDTRGHEVAVTPSDRLSRTPLGRAPRMGLLLACQPGVDCLVDAVVVELDVAEDTRMENLGAAGC
jgi:hypothetical protein